VISALSEKGLNIKLTSAMFIIITILASGCTSSTNYKWGNYEQNIFDYYHEPSKRDEVISSHLAMVNGESTQKLAPGMYAEAGTFYLERGDRQNAIFFYMKEKEAWPESAQLMDALVANLQGDTPKQ